MNEDTLRDKGYIFRVVEKFFLTLSSKDMFRFFCARLASLPFPSRKGQTCQVNAGI